VGESIRRAAFTIIQMPNDKPNAFRSRFSLSPFTGNFDMVVQEGHIILAWYT